MSQFPPPRGPIDRTRTTFAMGTELEEVYDRLLGNPGVVFLLGGVDTGKTTFGIELVRRATELGIAAAIVDADIAQSTVGPPTTVGLKLCSGIESFAREGLRQADGLGFVGAITPRGHLLSLVTATAKLVDRARAADCALIVVDTTSLVAGLHGQLLKFHKMELVEPDFVVAFERGEELEPLRGIAQRFTPADVIKVGVGLDVAARSVEERMTFREEQFAAYFSTGVSRWRVKPMVFMPTLPPEFDLGLLESIVVGMDDGKGTCVGIGVLEFDQSDGILRMASPVSEGVRGLRLGSIKIDTGGRSKGPVSFINLFRTE
jgi:polynucleotide 5'-kinase involved in rRNA processing